MYNVDTSDYVLHFLHSIVTLRKLTSLFQKFWKFCFSWYFFFEKTKTYVYIVFTGMYYRSDMKSSYMWGFFFRRGKWGNFCNMANIFTCRRPNGLGGGAIDHPDRSEQVPDQHYIPDVSENFFKDDISMVHRQKTFIFGVLKAFISNFTYYNL